MLLVEQLRLYCVCKLYQSPILLISKHTPDITVNPQQFYRDTRLNAFNFLPQNNCFEYLLSSKLNNTKGFNVWYPKQAKI